MLGWITTLVIAATDPCACETWLCHAEGDFHVYLAQYPNHGILQGRMGGRRFAEAAGGVGRDLEVSLVCGGAQSSGDLVTSCQTVAEDIGGDFVVQLRRGDGIHTPMVYVHARAYEQTLAEALPCTPATRDAGTLSPPLLTPQVIWPDETSDPICNHPYAGDWPFRPNP